MKFLPNWPIHVEIFEVRQNGQFRKTDRARRVVKDSAHFFEFKKEKIRTKPFKPEFLFSDDKGRQHLKLFSPAAKVYYPIVLDVKDKDEDGNPRFKTISEDSRRWVLRDIDETYKKYTEKRSFLAEYGALLAMITFAGIFLIVLAILSGYIESITGGLAQLADSVLKMGDYINIGPRA